MPVLQETNGCGISILKWDGASSQYIFDNSPERVIYFNQEQKFINIKSENRFICIHDADDIGFHDKLTIFISGANNMLKIGAMNLIRMFYPGWLVTKQSCYILLQCSGKVITTSCSIITMKDTNLIQGAYKNRIIGKDQNTLILLDDNYIQLKKLNVIKCREGNTINMTNNNVIVTTNKTTINCGNNNIIICQDDCIIHCDGDNIIIGRNNCIIHCDGDTNFINVLTDCKISIKNNSTLICDNNNTIEHYLNCSIYCNALNILIDKILNTIITTDSYSMFLNSNSGYEDIIEPIEFDRMDYINELLTTKFGNTVDNTSWSYGVDNPEPFVPFTWSYPKNFNDDALNVCDEINVWITTSDFNYGGDYCCKEDLLIPSDCIEGDVTTYSEVNIEFNPSLVFNNLEYKRLPPGLLLNNDWICQDDVIFKSIINSEYSTFFLFTESQYNVENFSITATLSSNEYTDGIIFIVLAENNGNILVAARSARNPNTYTNSTFDCLHSPFTWSIWYNCLANDNSEKLIKSNIDIGFELNSVIPNWFNQETIINVTKKNNMYNVKCSPFDNPATINNVSLFIIDLDDPLFPELQQFKGIHPIGFGCISQIGSNISNISFSRLDGTTVTETCGKIPIIPDSNLYVPICC